MEALFQSGKRCPDCGETKPLTDFPRNRRCKDGRHAYWMPCRNARGHETRQRLYGGSRHCHLTRRYGISAARAQTLIEEQGGVCAICRERAPDHVDHAHATGTVRGMLCLPCNTGLGHFNDDVVLMRQAIDDLNRHRPRDVHEPPTPYILSVA
ncbi:MAG: endonuclease VII domain-containing protein [Actinomycetota bacterium]